jgi:branched-chain amino acid transport system ATP-binding protein/urea transport system ATP-binding protein
MASEPDILLRTAGLTKAFGGLVALRDIDFTLREREMRCIIGPNGAGKTTFLSLLSGHQRPTSGTIYWRGREITGLPVYRVSRLGIVRKYQAPTVYERLSVRQNFEIAILGASQHHSAASSRSPDEIAAIVRLDALLDSRVSTLSHGQKQWLEIGMVIANDARLLLLDEPTAGMTAEETRATAELIRHSIEALHVSAIIIEHDINFVRELEAPVTVLDQGRVLAEGSFDEISHDEGVRTAYLGETE